MQRPLVRLRLKVADISFTQMTRRVCIILKFIAVLRSDADHRHVEIWK